MERRWWTLIAVSIGIVMLLLDITGRSETSGALAAGFELPRPLVGQPSEITIGAPPEIRRAGGRRLAAFRLGRAVTAQSGCLACHRIADVGNRGPGQNLTYVGSRLSSRQIERSILHAREPMPSFTGLPKRKLRAMVEFLSLLRRPEGRS